MKSSVLASAVLSCAVFSCLTAPLAVFGSNLIDIELQRENVFVGRLKDVAMPYLGLAGLVSFGAGAVSFSISEWRRAALKSNQVETQLIELKNELKEKSTQIDDLRLSDTYLSANGFQAFLQSDIKDSISASEKVAQLTPSKSSEPSLSNSDKHYQVHSPVEEMLSSQPLHLQPLRNVIETHAFQAPRSAIAIDRKEELPKSAAPEVLTHLSNLQNQIKQVESYIEALQSSLQPPVVASETSNSYGVELQQLHRRLQLLELDWIRHQTAS